MLRFNDYGFTVEREPLIRPFHFKGGYFTEKWINVMTLHSESGRRATAIGGSAVLWSDPKVFFSCSETGGNILMAAMAERGAQLARGQTFRNPIEAIQSILTELHTFGCRITGRKDLNRTFTLNTLVSLDLALWKLYADEMGNECFSDILPDPLQHILSFRQTALVHIPLITYNVEMEELLSLVDRGHFLLKIKLGQQGDQAEMLRQDMERLTQIHQVLRNKQIHNPNGDKILYYLDANSRYEKRETLLRLVDHMDKIGMLDQVVVFEEPFPYEELIDVTDIPLRVAADESLHSIDDLHERIDLGYGAIAVKPAGKTLSMSLLMAEEAIKRNIPCYVADSGCVPLLLEWNKNVAAILPSFPGLACGIIESNGAQNYLNWKTLIKDHPCFGSSWVEPKNGVFVLDQEFFNVSGGIFLPSGHYEALNLY